MRFVLVNDRAARGTPACAHCATLLGLGYLKDMSSRRFYCDYACYMVRTTRSFYFGAGFSGLFGGSAQPTSDFRFRSEDAGAPLVR